MHSAGRFGSTVALVAALAAVYSANAQGRGRPPDRDQVGKPPGGGPPEDGRRPEIPIVPKRDPTEISIVPGRVGDEILCAGDRNASYRIYAPRAYTAERRWPVMFVVAQGGGSPTALRRYADGAEANGWLVAVSIPAGKSGPAERDAVDAMIRDVAERVPSDPGRFFMSGLGDAAKLALTCAAAPKSYRIAGVLIAGPGDRDLAQSGPPALYALCGTNAAGRRDLVALFDPPGGRLWRLEFFPGIGSAGEAEDFALGMAWLNAVTWPAETAARRGPPIAAARERFEKELLERVARRKASDPERAYDWAECLTLLNSPDFEKNGVLVPHAAAVGLRDDPRVKAYREGRAELLNFAAQALSGEISGPDALLQARTLAFRYRNSRLRALFEALGQSAK